MRSELVLLAAVSLAAAASQLQLDASLQPVCEQAGPLVCAHSGHHCAAVPPATWPAFQESVAAKAACVEVDVSRTADGHLWALHPRHLQELHPAEPTAQVSGPNQRCVPGSVHCAGLGAAQAHDTSCACRLDRCRQPSSV